MPINIRSMIKLPNPNGRSKRSAPSQQSRTRRRRHSSLIRSTVAAACLLGCPLASPAPNLIVTNGLQLWLRGDAGVTTNAGGGVLQWADQSGHANNATPINGAQAPGIIANALNTRPVLRFDGVDDYLEVADSDSLSFVRDLSTFFVIRFDDFAWFRAVWGKTAANFPAPTDLYAVPGSGLLRAVRGDGDIVNSINIGSVDSARPLPAGAYLMLGVQVAGDTVSHYLNDQENGTGTVTPITADANTDLKIGTRDDLFTRLKGDLAELLIFDRALSSLERSNVFFYLHTRYNLNLPPTVTLASDPGGPNVAVGAVVTLDAIPVDLDGTIARVEFLSGGVLLGTATQPPYALRVTIDSSGEAKFTARAIDNQDATATSLPINLTASSSGPTNLSVLSGLQLWLRADAGTFPGHGDGVVEWADQSGNANSAFQADEIHAPVLTTNAVNGLPALRFDGANDYLDVPDSDSLSIVGDITSFFILKFDDFATFRAVWGKTAGNLPASTDFYALPGSGVPRAFRGNGTGFSSGYADGARAFPAGQFVLAGFDMAGTTLTHYLNGTANGSGPIAVTLADWDTPLKIGTRDDFVTRLRGEMAELVIYDRALSSVERHSVEHYLAEKYGLALVSVTNIAPVVAVTNPVSEWLQAPGMKMVAVDAFDADGSIASVQIFGDGVLLGTDVVAPYTAALNLTYGGAVNLSAIATDNLGARATSATVRVCVQGPGRPGGLVGYWPLDGNAAAVIGSDGFLDGLHLGDPFGTLLPGPTRDRNGSLAGALAFNGLATQRVEVPGGGGLNAATRGTIALWARWTGPQDLGVGGAAGAVLARQRDGQFSANIISLNSTDPNTGSIQWRQNSGAVNITSRAVVVDGTWRHIAVTFTTTNSELFMDGASEGVGAGGSMPDNPATPLTIGAWTGDGGSFSTASIDDVAIWDRVLTPDEILRLATGTSMPLELLLQSDCLTIEQSGMNVTVRWSSAAVLQSATNVNGLWEDVSGAANPYTTTAGGEEMYFRLRYPLNLP